MSGVTGDAPDGAHRELRRDYFHTFGTPEGKRVLDDIVKSNFILRSTFAPQCPDKTLVNEGQRLAALEILQKAGYKLGDLLEEPTEPKVNTTQPKDENEQMAKTDGSGSGSNRRRWGWFRIGGGRYCWWKRSRG